MSTRIFAAGDARLEDGFRFANRRGDVRAAVRDGVRIERVERFAEGVVIQRHRTLQKGAARESDQAHAIAFQFCDEIGDGEFCAGEPVGLHVLREHALRGVHGEEQFESLAMRFLPDEAGLRTRQRDEKKDNGEGEKRALDAPARRGDRGSEFVQQPRGGELPERGALREIEPAILPEECAARDGADSGMIPFLLILELLSKEKRKFSHLVEEMIENYPCSGEINSHISDPAGKIEEIAGKYSDGKEDRLDGLSVEYERWRFNLRMSNTEPIIRLNVESKEDIKLMKEKTEELLKIIRG